MTSPAPFRRYPAPSDRAIGIVLDAIAAGGKPGFKVGEILRLLVKGGAELGELVEYDAVAAGISTDQDGSNRRPWRVDVVGRGMRPSWFERLAKAIELGALEAYSAKEAADILLRPK